MKFAYADPPYYGLAAKFYGHLHPDAAREPVIFKSARGASERALPAEGAGLQTTRDYLAAPIALRRGLVGAKPEAFCRWIFDLIGLRPGDPFVDMFPGSGAVGAAWERWSWSLDCEAGRRVG